MNAPRRTAFAAALIAALAAGAAQAERTGTLARVLVHGDALVGNLEGDSPDREVSIYLPPSYSADPNRRYPVLYVLHGFTDSDDRWFGLRGRHFINLPGALDRAYANGARELIVVMPNAFTKYQGSMYSSSVTTGDWEAFVARDLVRYIDANYRTIPERASRGLAGHSMGGYGTWRIGMKYPAVFAALYSLSPCCMAASLAPSSEAVAAARAVTSEQDIAEAGFGVKAMLASAAAWSPDPSAPPRYFDLPFEHGELVPEVVAAWAANAPLAMIRQYVPELETYRAIAVDAGDEDVAIAATVRRLDAILSGYGIDHVMEIYPGNHVNRIEQRFETKVVPFFSEHLSFTASSP